MVGWGPGSKGRASSHHAKPTFELPSDHGNQRQDKGLQQRGAEEHGIRKSRRKAEETELVVLDPEHVRSLQILSFFAELMFVFL